MLDIQIADNEKFDNNDNQQSNNNFIIMFIFLLNFKLFFIKKGKLPTNHLSITVNILRNFMLAVVVVMIVSSIQLWSIKLCKQLPVSKYINLVEKTLA